MRLSSRGPFTFTGILILVRALQSSPGTPHMGRLPVCPQSPRAAQSIPEVYRSDSQLRREFPRSCRPPLEMSIAPKVGLDVISCVTLPPPLSQCHFAPSCMSLSQHLTTTEQAPSHLRHKLSFNSLQQVQSWMLCLNSTFRYSA